MKAIVYTQYGPPEVLQIKEVTIPSPKDNEVLIKIHATTINRNDCGFRKPEYPFIIRPINGLFRPKRTILGTELAGEIMAIGRSVKNFKIGDSVFGLSTWGFGTHAEYICLPENGSIAFKPSNLNFEEAAGICDGAYLALNILREFDFSMQPHILINGASGSIGTAGVQLAKHFGATVTAVTSSKNMELVKSLGADYVIDYTKTDFTKNGQVYDFVFDAVGKSSYFKCKKIMKPHAIYISTELGFMAQNVFIAMLSPIMKGRKIKFPIPKDTQKDIIFMKELIEAGKYRAIIDKVYPMEQVVDAAKYVETGMKTGNVIIKIV